ncbi:hypothetical protein [Breoghania sp.]|uniref:hypothetical protein n=1 Tax=Breoghania sp. TaxID=2065378 RepID=UPI002635E170|nr:hypothetical protein [Breoghania sp.]MDJ0932800.1 hypothetical protein [Breoghania sp.]
MTNGTRRKVRRTAAKMRVVGRIAWTRPTSRLLLAGVISLLIAFTFTYWWLGNF